MKLLLLSLALGAADALPGFVRGTAPEAAAADSEAGRRKLPEVPGKIDFGKA